MKIFLIENETDNITAYSIAKDAAAVIRKKTHLESLDVIPSDIRLERVTNHMYTRPKREELLRKALEPIIADYDFVVLALMGQSPQLRNSLGDRGTLPMQR